MVASTFIGSKDNKRIKDLKKLQMKKYRKKEGRFLIEGEHLVEEAVRYHQTLHTLILLEGYDPTMQIPEGTEMLSVSRAVMKTLSTLDTPPGVMAAVSYVAPEVGEDNTLLLDGVQDPGNLGTLIRSADAFGFKHIILSHDTVDPFSDKVLRSTQGSLFHIHLETAEPTTAVNAFQGIVMGTAIDGAVLLDDTPSPEASVMVVLGNEGRGVSEEVLSLVDQKLKIGMPGDSESLNVAVAGSIIMHHFKA
ncbi:TrmH family RNA methyltransferase [Salinicoccus siamensis]|uniref:TrmH family RNA methyltransferase n=1 Tax=Salinicoccus siamensis TaxID=381830 RepID=A0ABV5Z2N0_9STAP